MRQIRDKPGTVKQDCAAGPNRLQVCRPYEGGNVGNRCHLFHIRGDFPMGCGSGMFVAAGK